MKEVSLFKAYQNENEIRHKVAWQAISQTKEF